MRTFKYEIIEYEYKSMTYQDQELKIEVCKELHRTNCFLVYLLIILSFKIKGIKYEVLRNGR